MHHHVRIAADGGSEVRIIVERQTIVAYIVGRIFSLLHSPDGDRFDQILFRLALDGVEQVVDAFGNIRLRTLGLQVISEAADEGGEVLHLVGIGEFVDTIDEGLFRLALWRTTDKFCYGAVGKEHELLNQLIRLFRFLEIDAQRLALLVDFKFHLVTLEVDGAVAEATVAKLFRQVVEGENCLFAIALAGFDDFLRLLVGEAAVALDDCPANARVDDIRFVIHFEDSREAKFFLVRPQRADLVAETFGQHRNRAVHQINGGRTVESLSVDDALGVDVVRNVGDMDTDLPIPILQFSSGKRVVEVLRILRVDGKRQDLAEILAAGDFFRADDIGNAVRCLLHVLRIYIR